MFRSASNWQPPAPQVASLDPNESLSGWRDLRREGFIEPYRSANRHGGIHTKCNANKSPLFIVEFRELLGLCPLKHLPLHCPGAAFIGAKDSSRLPTPGASVAGSKRRDACFVFFDSQHDLQVLHKARIHFHTALNTKNYLHDGDPVFWNSYLSVFDVYQAVVDSIEELQVDNKPKDHIVEHEVAPVGFLQDAISGRETKSVNHLHHSDVDSWYTLAIALSFAALRSFGILTWPEQTSPGCYQPQQENPLFVNQNLAQPITGIQTNTLLIGCNTKFQAETHDIQEVSFVLLDLNEVKDVAPGIGFENWSNVFRGKMFVLQAYDKVGTARAPGCELAVCKDVVDMKIKIDTWLFELGSPLSDAAVVGDNYASEPHVSAQPLTSQHSRPSAAPPSSMPFAPTPLLSAAKTAAQPAGAIIAGRAGADLSTDFLWALSNVDRSKVISHTCATTLNGFPCKHLARCYDKGYYFKCPDYNSKTPCNKPFAHKITMHTSYKCQKTKRLPMGQDFCEVEDCLKMVTVVHIKQVCRQWKNTGSCTKPGCPFGHDFREARAQQDREYDTMAERNKELDEAGLSQALNESLAEQAMH